jgi:hypothetical protein|tara:strand:+ start:1614 stop:2402 length:789 start_codon:yes stop_codon:yes gene_type:complete
MEVQMKPIQTNGHLSVVDNVDNSLQLFSRSPKKALSQMQELVQVMSSKCQGKEFIAIINGKQYPKVEWWTTVAATLGLFPVVVYSRRLDREGELAYEARVEVRYGDRVVGAGEAMCSNKETRWSSADEYAIRSMSITRATGKCYRLPLSFLAVMAGLNPTPAEEIPINNDFSDDSEEYQEESHQVEESASEAQIYTLGNLIENAYLSNEERLNLSKTLEHSLTKSQAKELLNTFLGRSELIDGKWEKVSQGIIDQRKEQLPD